MTPGAISDFKRAAVAHGSHQDKRGNEHADRLVAIAKRLREEDRLSDLVPLTTDESPSVRLWAATNLLELDRAHAESVLEKIAREDEGLVGFSAEQTLHEWRAGRLNLRSAARRPKR